MGFNNYLLKIGTANSNNVFTITGEKYVDFASYSAIPKVQDVDAYRDANGVLHRNTVEHVPLVVSFETLRLTNTELGTLMTGISNNYINALERKVLVTAFCPEKNDYVTQEMYWAEPEIKIESIDIRNSVIKYLPIKMEFIGY
jgi:hypothetical protein